MGELGARLKADAAAIAFPRASGSPGNERARTLVADRLRDAGLEVEVQPFSYDIEPAFHALRWTLRLAAATVAAAGLALARAPLVSAVLLVATIVGGAALLGWSPAAERLYRREGAVRSANVAGRRRARVPRARTLVVLAHHDSKSQNLSLPVRLGATVLAILGGSALAVVTVMRLAVGPSAVASWTGPALGLLAGLALAVLSTLRNGNASPGGVDNAGSVAILLELARSLPARLPADVELIVLSPSAEEDHMVGAMRWLDASLARERAAGGEVVALNLDGAGSPGRAVMMEWFGLGGRFGPRSARVVRGEAARLGIPLRRIWMAPAVGVDAIPFAHRGVECVTLSSGSLGPATFAVHTAGDVADHLDEATLERVATLAREVAVALARGGADR